MFTITAPNADMKGISRIDSGSTHGWFVRAYKNGKTYSRLFSDGKWKGRDEALAAAREYREKLNARLEQVPVKPRSRRVVFRDSRNTTGVLGVSRSAKRTPRGTLSESYAVTWRPEPGMQKCTSFSINKYGDEKAFKLAVNFRLRKLREIHGLNMVRKLKGILAEKGIAV
jgi:hypothetical protein